MNKCEICGNKVLRKRDVTCSKECYLERNRRKSKDYNKAQAEKRKSSMNINFLNEPCPFADGRLPREVTKNACWL